MAAIDTTQRDRNDYGEAPLPEMVRPEVNFKFGGAGSGESIWRIDDPISEGI